MRSIFIIGLSVLASGCATTTKTTTYWTEKSGIVTVHHVVGTVDQTEKLTQKRLTKEEIAGYKLPKGTYFRVESEHTDSPTASAKAEAKGTTKDTQSAKAGPKAKTKDAQSGTSNDRIAEKIDDLRRQVQGVAAENRRLQEQINASAQQQEIPQQTAQEDVPRLSQ